MMVKLKINKMIADMGIVGINNIKIYASEYVSDYETVVRPWKERLFSLPFRPLQKTKTVYNPTAYIIDNICYVSVMTHNYIGHGTIPEPCIDKIEENIVDVTIQILVSIVDVFILCLEIPYMIIRNIIKKIKE